MTVDWTQLECELIVADYLEMLHAELSQEPYNKSEHRRQLKAKLNSRTDSSIEFKHQNISAVMIQAGYVYISGYKPAWNFQDLLQEVVLARISGVESALIQLESKLIESLPNAALVQSTNEILEEAPQLKNDFQIRDRAERKPRQINYSEREAANRRLGELGEEFVLSFEQKRLEELGRIDLIKDLEWTSKKRGDGAGYDIRSFCGSTDEELFIEVKTTNAGKYQPFLISSNEVSFASENSSAYSLYRVFMFSSSRRMFRLEGSISSHVRLTPKIFSASF